MNEPTSKTQRFYVLLELGAKDEDSMAGASLVSSWINGTDGHIGNFNLGDDLCWVESVQTFDSPAAIVAAIPEIKTLTSTMQHALTAIADYMVDRYGSEALIDGLSDAAFHMTAALEDVGITYEQPDEEEEADQPEAGDGNQDA